MGTPPFACSLFFFFPHPQDAHEFLLILLEWLHNDVNEVRGRVHLPEFDLDKMELSEEEGARQGRFVSSENLAKCVVDLGSSMAGPFNFLYIVRFHLFCVTIVLPFRLVSFRICFFLVQNADLLAVPYFCDQRQSSRVARLFWVKEPNTSFLE